MSSPRDGSGSARVKSLKTLVLLVLLSASALLLVPAAVTWAVPPGVAASFTYSPGLPVSNQTVVFNSTSTASGSNNQIVTQTWDLDGDGIFGDATGPISSRAFPAAGVYQVGLFVTDTRGNQSQSTQTVTVNALPSASFVYTASPLAGELVSFFSTSSDSDGFIASQAWDLDDDGQFDDGATTLASRSFDTPGHYTVRLRVVDNRGASHVAGVKIIVGSSSDAVGPVGELAAGLKLLSPFPVVRIIGVASRAGIRVRLLAVNAPVGARVSIRCRSRGCPFRRSSRLIAGAAREQASISKLIRFGRFKGRLLRPGTVVQVFVTKPGRIGKYTKLRVRRARLPARTDRCLFPGTTRPVACPS